MVKMKVGMVKLADFRAARKTLDHMRKKTDYASTLDPRIIADLLDKLLRDKKQGLDVENPVFHSSFSWEVWHVYRFFAEDIGEMPKTMHPKRNPSHFLFHLLHH